MGLVSIKVQTEDFDLATEYNHLKGGHKSGAVVTFSGLVRDDDGQLLGLELEHYPGMTEKSLSNIADVAKTRWSLNDVSIIHRVGYLKVNEQIVFVGVASAHRQSAFEAANFIMDYLKTQAPFWKKEHHTHGEAWVAAKESDQQAADQWQE
ncbi:MAG: molybdopterin synthase catalytic subunit MoaE [Pseudomonadota bacterium]